MKVAYYGSGLFTSSRDSDEYEEFSSDIKKAFEEVGDKPLFTTDVTGQWQAFLSYLPDFARQYYNCNCCKEFINRYGGLVTISESGKTESALWKTKVPFFREAVRFMREGAEAAEVTGVFISSEKVYGTPHSGGWGHLSVTPQQRRVWNSKVMTASQVTAEKLEDFGMLTRALRLYSLETINSALNLLITDSLYRSEKVIGVAEWLKNLHTKLEKTKNKVAKRNIMWMAVATAPTGYCHVHSTMIGTLLDDIQDGLSFDEFSKRFASKMKPTQYQRPQAAPTVGNVIQAEKIIEKLQIAESLERRFARVEELQTVWKLRKNKAKKADGVFSHLTTKEEVKTKSTVSNPRAMVITWEKFKNTVLPNAISMEYLVKATRENFAAIITATHESAPPIIQWDSEYNRNPFSEYVYNGGSFPARWNLVAGYVPVTAISLTPSMWQEGFEQHSKTVNFILEGAKDTGYRSSGNALFPEILKSELREIRSTIEQYSKSAVLDGYAEASACGIAKTARNDSSWDLTLRVTTSTGVSIYKLDRWD